MLKPHVPLRRARQLLGGCPRCSRAQLHLCATSKTVTGARGYFVQCKACRVRTPLFCSDTGAYQAWDVGQIAAPSAQLPETIHCVATLHGEVPRWMRMAGRVAGEGGHAAKG